MYDYLKYLKPIFSGMFSYKQIDRPPIFIVKAATVEIEISTTKRGE